MKIYVKHTGIRYDKFDDTFFDDMHKFVIDEDATIEQYFGAFMQALKCETFSEDLVNEYAKKLGLQIF